MIITDRKTEPGSLAGKLDKFRQLSGEKISLIEKHYDESMGSPVFTMAGKYKTRGWTDWTRGFQYGSAILQYDAAGEIWFLDYARRKTLEKMARRVSHFGVHDHGFNNISTYGNLLRLMRQGKIPFNEWEKNFYELALKISGAVQAARWTSTEEGGFIHSFNGPHSLFVDTIRSCRSLIVSHLLGHSLQGEGDIRINLLERALHHIGATARYSVSYGQNRDIYDVRGRTTHESIFNVKDGSYRCSATQQGYSGFSTWTRGLAWAMLGFAEQLECIETVRKGDLEVFGSKNKIVSMMLKAALATCDYYIGKMPSDGIPYWDTGAPGLSKLVDYLDKPADPFNGYEPVDSSAAAIAAQALLRMGRYLHEKGDPDNGARYWQCGLTVVRTLLDDPYTSSDPEHQGLLLHSVYHRPNGWDYVPEGHTNPFGESCMWGDYHIREVCLYLQRIINNEDYYTFFSCAK